MNRIYKFNLKVKGTESIGFLVPLELNDNIPFDVKRIFYTYGIHIDNERGNHAYYNTKQVLICISGSLKIRVFNGENEDIYLLDKPNEALYIGPKIWRTTFEHSDDSVLLVLSSIEYDEQDYIRDFDTFMEVIKCT